MKKMVVFHPTIAPYRIDFFNDLSSGFDVKIALFYRNLKDQKFKYEEIEKNFMFKPDYFDKSINFFGREIPIGFIKRLKQDNPDIVLVNEYNESFFAAELYRTVFKKKYKIISICDDSADMVKNGGGLHAKARDMVVKNLDGIVLCNDLAQKIYQEKYPCVKTFVMPIIQDEKKYFNNKDYVTCRAKEIAQKEGLLGKRVFLYVGRISPEKNPMYLVKSFFAQHEDNPENILYLIGDYVLDNKSYNDAIEDYIDSHHASSYIRVIGRREGDELKARFYAGQVLILPSIREAFGAVTNEALLCGNYVMVSSVAGSTCLVSPENGEILDISKPVIDFTNMNKRVPLLNIEYIDKKKNKMNVLYNQYINGLKDWINNL